MGEILAEAVFSMPPALPKSMESVIVRVSRCSLGVRECSCRLRKYWWQAQEAELSSVALKSKTVEGAEAGHRTELWCWCYNAEKARIR